MSQSLEAIFRGWSIAHFTKIIEKILYKPSMTFTFIYPKSSDMWCMTCTTDQQKSTCIWISRDLRKRSCTYRSLFFTCHTLINRTCHSKMIIKWHSLSNFMDEWLADDECHSWNLWIATKEPVVYVTGSVTLQQVKVASIASFSVTCYEVECGFYFTSDENFFNHGATYGFGREERCDMLKGLVLE